MAIDEGKRKTGPILERYGVAYAALFGSVARGEDRPQNDVDILVRLGHSMGMVEYMDLIQSLEETLQEKVDLVTEQSLNKHVRPCVTPDLTTIYEKG